MKPVFEDLGKISSTSLGCDVFFVRKRGTGHVAEGKVCQDYCLAGSVNEKFVLFAAADGHGSEEYTKSDIGAMKACEILFELLSSVSIMFRDSEALESKLPALIDSKEFKAKYISDWRSAVLKDYKKNERADGLTDSEIIHKYGTTILFAAVTERNFILGQLGDGAILMFSKSGKSQIFCRSLRKRSSATNSLASGNALYSFFTGTFPRRIFSRVIVSTDGIYDRLSKGDSFLVYAEELESRSSSGVLRDPFAFGDYDVSEITSDDCTVGLIVSGKEHRDSFSLPGYFGGSVSQRRFLGGIGIYRSESDGHVYEIHVSEGHKVLSESIRLQCAEIMRPSEILETLSGKIFIYEIPEGSLSLRELYEQGRLMEKSYNPVRDDDDDDDQENIYTNDFVLRLYEKLIALDSELSRGGIDLNSFYPETTFICGEKILIASDALIQGNCESPMKKCLDYFSIIGKLCYDGVEVPLFATLKQGQTITAKEKRLCRVAYNAGEKIYGLWNISDSSWQVEGPNAKEFPTGSVLRLKGDVSFVAEGTKYSAVMLR